MNTALYGYLVHATCYPERLAEADARRQAKLAEAGRPTTFRRAKQALGLVLIRTGRRLQAQADSAGRLAPQA
jgi:hypothetical protein